MLQKSLRASGRKSGFVVVFLLLSLFAAAQTGSLKGTVKDANGQPMAGASVTIEGTKKGTTTDVNGNYLLKLAPGNYKLVISYVGLTSQSKDVTVLDNAVTENNFDMANAQDLNRVLVVGSRAAPRSATQTAVPVDVISSREMTLTGQVEPTQMINFIAPSYNSSRQTIADGTDHIDPATIRGLGPDQVLVLVNGRRRYNTALLNVNGTIGRGSVGTDLNSIVPASIEKVEVLRDGAASQYGSDAIAGVVNVVLKKNATGTTLYGHMGQHYAGDGLMKQVGFNKGLRLGKEGFFNVSGDFRFREGTNRAGDYTGAVYINGNPTLDQQIIAMRGFSRKNNMQIGNSAVDNYGVVANAGFPLSKNTKFFLTGGLNWRDGEAAGFYRYPRQTSQVIAALYPDGFLPEIHSFIRDRYLTAGVEGVIGGGWNWDLSQTSGGNSFEFTVKNSNNASQFADGANAQTKFYAGTLRFAQHTSNLNFSKDFGKNMGIKSFNLAFGGEFRIDNYEIEEGEEASWKNYAPASGRVGGAQVFPGFQPSNAINENRKVAAGYVDIETDITDNFLLNAAGRVENYSDYGTNVAGKLAMRYKFAEAFSLRGSASNGFRAPSLHQRYFSAISTVFLAAGPGGSLIPVQQGTFRNNSGVAGAFGVPSLDAEKSLNFSAGFTSKIGKKLSVTVDGYQINIKDRIVLSGAFLRYNSNGTPNAAIDAILDRDPALADVGSAAFFSNAIDTRTRGIDMVATYTTKYGKGDLVLTLAGNLNKTEVQGTPKVAANLPSGSENTLFDREQRGRFELGQPRNKFSLNANYRIGRWMANARATRFGRVETLHPTNTALDESFDPRVVTDLSLAYKIGNFMTWTIGANNVGNVYPEKLKYFQTRDPQHFANTSDSRFVYSRNATQFGFNGGYYYTSLALELHNMKFEKKAKPAVIPPAAVEKPKDTDGDGILDINDECPAVAGPASLKGCPDKDGDGITDAVDACPDAAGPATLKGCPDKDGDGVADAVDACPDAAGPASLNGCPDKDGDGIADAKDACPDEAGIAENNGCPRKEVSNEVKETVDKAARNIYFETSSNKLKATSNQSLDVVAQMMKEDNTLYLDIEGHTDNVGTDAFNQQLSEKRANAVKAALIKRGVDESRMTAKGFGETQPIADNGTADGRAQNRRVDMKLRY